MSTGSYSSVKPEGSQRGFPLGEGINQIGLGGQMGLREVS